MRNYQLDPREDNIDTWTCFTQLEDSLISLDRQLAEHGLEIVWGFLDNSEAVYVKIESRMTNEDRDFCTRESYDF